MIISAQWQPMMRFRFILLCLGLMSFLSACTFGVPIGSSGHKPGSQPSATPSNLPKSKYGNPSSYVVFGKRYYVLDSSEGFVERGLASWYGKKFHGRKTSSGEIYNMHAMTAAHKSLPLPTYVRVENLENGRTVVVLVNDRGPFVGDRIIDLSFAAAEKLGVVGPGTAQVEISALSTHRNQPIQAKPTPIQQPVPQTVPKPEPAVVATAVPTVDTPRPVVRAVPLIEQGGPEEVPLFVQVGSFGSQINATNMVQELKNANETVTTVSQLETENGLFYRVRIGPLFDVDEANAVVLRLNQKGFTSTRIVVQD